MTTTKLTDLERQAIQGILDSDYMDGMTGADCVDHMVWTWSANPFGTKAKFAGVISSLNQKGFTKSTDEGRDSVIWITKAGMDAFLGAEEQHDAHVDTFNEALVARAYGRE